MIDSSALQGAFATAITGIGALCTTYLAIRFTRFLWLYNRPSSLRKYRRPGAWALVTGATDGIGKALAFELAEDFNVVLHGRNPTKLQNVKDGLSKAFPQRSFVTLIADASDSLTFNKNIEAIARTVNGLPGPLTILINNVGGSVHKKPLESLEEKEPDAIDSTITLNNRFTVHLTQALIPKLNRDGPSIIVNVGSLSGLTGIPYLSIYTATKAFINQWSVSMTRELRVSQSKVDCIGLLVGAVTGTVSITADTGLFRPDTKTFARSILRMMVCGRELVNPWWPHSMQQFFMDHLPEALQAWFVNVNVSAALQEEDIGKKRA